MTKRQALDGYVASWNRQDADGLAALWSEDAERVSALGNARGRQAIKEACQRFWAFSADSTISVLEVAETDGAILYRFRDEGHHTGPLQTANGPVAGTGAVFGLEGMSVLRFGSDGLITSEHLYFDPASLFRQLGLA